MVDFKKYLKAENAPWYTRIQHEQKPVLDKREVPAEPEEEERDNKIEDVCNFVLHGIKNLTNTIKENHNNMPRDAKQGEKRNGLSFLKIDNLSTDKKLFTIKWAGTHNDAGMSNQFKHSLLAKIEDATQNRFWLSLAEDAPVLETLDNELGKDETQWNGRQIYLFLEQHKINENKYMRCEVRPSSETPAHSLKEVKMAQ